MYYVYEWFLLDTDEVIYVGKGTGNRYKVRKHNKFFNDFLKRFACDSRIVKEFENEADAFNYEYERINELKAKEQCVCNIREGGFGGTTEWWTDDLRERYSEYNVMKSERQRKRMSEQNPMKNHEIAQKTNAQKKRAVIIGNATYPSVKEAHEKIGVATDTIILWCKKGINNQGEQCRYADSEQVVFTDKRYNKGSCKPLTYKGKHYESPLDLAEELKCSASAIYSWLKRGFDTKGEPCRYDCDTRNLEFQNRYVVRNKTRAKRIIVNGIKYRSCAEASKELGIPKSTLYSYLQGKKHNDKYICAYDNQQPSQGNTNNSTLEGSTTNG